MWNDLDDASPACLIIIITVLLAVVATAILAGLILIFTT